MTPERTAFVSRHGLVQYKPGMGRKYPRAGVCEVCERLPGVVCGKGYLLFDHCHAHGWTRGLLCGYCNDQLGLLENGQTSRRGFHVRSLPRLTRYRRNCPDCADRLDRLDKEAEG